MGTMESKIYKADIEEVPKAVLQVEQTMKNAIKSQNDGVLSAALNEPGYFNLDSVKNKELLLSYEFISGSFKGRGKDYADKLLTEMKDNYERSEALKFRKGAIESYLQSGGVSSIDKESCERAKKRLNLEWKYLSKEWEAMHLGMMVLNGETKEPRRRDDFGRLPSAEKEKYTELKDMYNLTATLQNNVTVNDYDVDGLIKNYGREKKPGVLDFKFQYTAHFNSKQFMETTPGKMPPIMKEYGLQSFNRIFDRIYDNKQKDLLDHVLKDPYDMITMDGKSMRDYCKSKNGGVEITGPFEERAKVEVMQALMSGEHKLQFNTVRLDKNGLLRVETPSTIKPVYDIKEPKHTFLENVLNFLGIKKFEPTLREKVDELFTNEAYDINNGGYKAMTEAIQKDVDKFVKDPKVILRNTIKCKCEEGFERVESLEMQFYGKIPGKNGEFMSKEERDVNFIGKNEFVKTLDRSGSRTSLAALFMLSKGYTMDDVFSKSVDMVNKKGELGREFRDILVKGDLELIGNTYKNMSQTLVDQPIPPIDPKHPEKNAEQFHQFVLLKGMAKDLEQSQSVELNGLRNNLVGQKDNLGKVGATIDSIGVVMNSVMENTKFNGSKEALQEGLSAEQFRQVGERHVMDDFLKESGGKEKFSQVQGKETGYGLEKELVCFSAQANLASNDKGISKMSMEYLKGEREATFKFDQDNRVSVDWNVGDKGIKPDVLPNPMKEEIKLEELGGLGKSQGLTPILEESKEIKLELGGMNK